MILSPARLRLRSPRGHYGRPGLSSPACRAADGCQGVYGGQTSMGKGRWAEWRRLAGPDQ
eukprot:scaffold17470_cov92-Isochrysis_galbana.AAC.1